MLKYQHFHLVIFSGQFGVNQLYLVKPISKILQRCVEHGIWDALWRIENHLKRLRSTEHAEKWKPSENDQQSLLTSQFEFGILAIGLTAAAIVFVCELLVGNQKKIVKSVQTFGIITYIF